MPSPASAAMRIDEERDRERDSHCTCRCNQVLVHSCVKYEQQLMETVRCGSAVLDVIKANCRVIAASIIGIRRGMLLGYGVYSVTS